MTALQVKEDGKIWLIPDLPEEPLDQRNVTAEYAAVMIEYQEALTSAKQSAVLCDDQLLAIALLYRYHKAGNPGIYPIPDLKWEEEMIHLQHLAILKESTPSEPENSFWQINEKDVPAFFQQLDKMNRDLNTPEPVEPFYQTLVGGKAEPVGETQLKSAKEILRSKGQIRVTLNDDPYVKWDYALEAMEEYMSEYSQTYQLRQSELVNKLYARITELEKGVQKEALTDEDDLCAYPDCSCGKRSMCYHK